MTSTRRVGGAAAAGALATVAVATSPIVVGMPPIVVPYVPIDLRVLVLPVLFAGLQGGTELARWPAPAAGTLVPGLGVAGLANLHTSQVLAFLGVGWARPGAAIDLTAMAACLGLVALGLGVAFDAARERFRTEMIDRGLAGEAVDPVVEWAGQRSRDAIAVSLVAVAALALVVRVAGGALGSAAVPLPGLAAIVLALGTGALLLGLPRLRSA